MVCLGNDNLLGISQTFSHNLNWWTAASAINIPFLWLDVFIFLRNKLNFIVFFSHNKKILQISESLAKKRDSLEQAKWTHYGGHMANAQWEHITQLKLFITHTSFGGLLQFEFSKFPCNCFCIGLVRTVAKVVFSWHHYIHGVISPLIWSDRVWWHQ